MERAAGESSTRFVVSVFSNEAAGCMFTAEMIPIMESRKICLWNLCMDKRYFLQRKEFLPKKEQFMVNEKTDYLFIENRRADIEISFLCFVFSQSRSLYLFFYFFRNLFTQ